MFTVINNILATLSNATLRYITLTADIISVAKVEPCYKAMLFVDNDGNFVPVVAFRSPFVGKQIPHKIVNNGLTNQSVILTDNGWEPTEGVSILFIKDGEPCYMVTSLTAFEINEKLAFLTSFSWFKGENAYDVFVKLSAFDELNYVMDFGEAGIYNDCTLTGVVRQSWFVKIWQAKIAKTAERKEINKKIVDTSLH